MDSVTFLDRASRLEPQPIYALTGDEDFLKRQVLHVLRQVVLGADADAFGLSTHAGDKAAFATVHDELLTLPFLSPKRLVVIDAADPFVTKYRGALEKYVGAPAATGVLVLDVRTWPANTRLAKLLAGDATITCKAPAPYKIPEWCIRWAASSQNKQLTQPAAALLADLVGADLGLLDQEVVKLAIFVGEAKRIDVKDVDQLVGSSRQESTWKVFDAIGAGHVKEALTIVDRLLDQGDEPLRILGAFSMQLRRLAQIARSSQLGTPLQKAMEEAGVPPFGQKSCEQQLRHLGRKRIERLYDWLLEVDVGLKSTSELPARTLLERLVIRLARTA